MEYFIWKSYKLKVEPFSVFEALSCNNHPFFLDSSLNNDYHLGRYSFLGSDPVFIIRSDQDDALCVVRDLLNSYKKFSCGIKLPFVGGAVGYISYDAGLRILKNRNPLKINGPDIPRFYFGFYNTIIAIDHLKKNLYICASAFPEKNERLARIMANQNLKKMQDLISGIDGRNKINSKETAKFNKRLKSDFTRSEYFRAVNKAKRYIKKGDIYQVNLAQQFSCKNLLPAEKIYYELRKKSPSYFSAYLDCGDFQIISSSPERFIRIHGDAVLTRPMKGTRPRGANSRQDWLLRQELLESAKDKAELMMIVDLERNDLGRVCSYGSVKVDSLRDLEEYSSVFQTTASVSGKLHKGKDVIDVLGACFPGGSITGCPKIRAMEIIEELEHSRRSIYTGCFGYISFTADADFNILIRTILKKGDRVYFGAGGGIVADSNPQEEYRETLVKAKAMMEVIGGRADFL